MTLPLLRGLWWPVPTMGLSEFEFEALFAAYSETGDTDKAYCRISDRPGSHPANSRNTVAIVTRPLGSDDAGPVVADYSLCLSNIKRNWTNPSLAQAGEIDGATIVVRQGGPSDPSPRSDASGLLLNVANYGDCGFVSCWEGSLNNYVSDGSGGTVANYTAQFTGGGFDAKSGRAYGFTFRLHAGECKDGFRVALESPSVNIEYAYHYVDNGVTKFSVSRDGTVYSAAGVKVGDNKVVGARDTGWTLMTGTANKSSALDTANATISQLAERVKALEAALAAHGLIGA